MEAPNYCYQFLFLLSYVIIVVANSGYNCSPGVQTVGVTVPKGDIKIEHGQSLEIFCMLDPYQSIKYNLTSSSLVFYHNDILVPHEFLNIVNETTLRLYVKEPPVSSSLYSCKIRTEKSEEGVCLNYVDVGTKPEPVKNFSCISSNWENLNCSWIPSTNPIKTEYRLFYTLRAKNRKSFECPDKNDIKYNFCLWNASTNPPHRLPYEEYYFKLTGRNIFGNITSKHCINHYSVVLPRKPENLSLVEATCSSLTISWALPLALRSFPAGIKSKVMYQAKWDTQNYWQEVNTTHLVNSSQKLTLNITGLKYAHTLYDIRVSLKSKLADNEEKWWSEPATITLRTKATVPGMPPKTDIGSFESKSIVEDTYREIRLYWQQIPRFLENGDNFEYKIIYAEEFIDGEYIQRNYTPNKITRTYAQFTNMSFNKYAFTIVSSNKEGISERKSKVIVPSKDQSPAEPVSLKKIDYDHGVYELSWDAPPSAHNVTSYTIFWCDNKNDRPYQCSGVLNWTMVSNNITQKNITLPADKIYQFAISANTNYSSSGMVWAVCTVLPDQERGKLKNIWINKIGPSFMELMWKLDCLKTRDIIGFEVSYCPIRDPQDSSCKEPLMKTPFPNDRTSSIIDKLRPYTTYMVYLAVVSEKGVGLKSDPLLNTTLEAAPDGPPRNLHLIKATNASITVSWTPPILLNGVLRFYQVYWNENSTRVENKSDVVSITLNGLLSFEDYHIQVSACTVACSNKSGVLIVKTKIGTPGPVAAPKVSYFNRTELNITLVPLERQRGGNVEYYNVKVQILNEEDVILSERTYNRSGAKSESGNGVEILTPGCLEGDSAQYYNVWARAVNIDNYGTTLPGPWSSPTKGFCYFYASTLIVILLSVVGFLALLFVCITMGYIARCILRRCEAMQNIRVKLPPQLELDIYKDKVIDLPMTAHVAPHKPINDDTHDIPPPDQQLLLQKKDKDELVESSNEDGEDVSGDRESSGCGSGHESVSSSITAGTHITDSGTEADEMPVHFFKVVQVDENMEIMRPRSNEPTGSTSRRTCKLLINDQSGLDYIATCLDQGPPSPDVFSDTPRRLSDLRQRNVSGSGGGDGYSRLAQLPSGYVTLPTMH